MKMTEINIRDPFIMTYEGKYYMYGTRSETCWGPAKGFDCYASSDFKEWEGPIEIFHRSDDFFADRNFWAPECIAYQGAFYLITTFAAENLKKGIYILRSEQPTGPFTLYSERLTPEDWSSIDGSIYFEGETPYLFFSHSFEDVPDGDVCVVMLTKDLKRAEGEPICLFSAKETPWAKPVPFAKAEFGMDGDVYFTDGPCVKKLEDGKLYMTWSSWSRKGYAVGVAVSKSGAVKGPWVQHTDPIFPEDGGHGMIYEDFDHTLKFVLHYPNEKYKERPVVYSMQFDQGKLQLQR